MIRTRGQLRTWIRLTGILIRLMRVPMVMIQVMRMRVSRGVVGCLVET
jgi:hypothetical protein